MVLRTFLMILCTFVHFHKRSCFNILPLSKKLTYLSSVESYRAVDNAASFTPTSLYPAPPTNLPPLIHHIISDSGKKIALRDLVVQETGLSSQYTNELIDFGAVYLADSTTSKARRCTNGNSPVPPTDGYVRVHVHPRRYAYATSINWAACLLAELEDVVVINKPPAVPTVPTVDNNGLSPCLSVCSYMPVCMSSYNKYLSAHHTCPSA
jgi:hypothetical protein